MDEVTKERLETRRIVAETELALAEAGVKKYERARNARLKARLELAEIDRLEREGEDEPSPDHEREPAAPGAEEKRKAAPWKSETDRTVAEIARSRSGSPYSVLIVTGPAGSGRTHAARRIAYAMTEADGDPVPVGFVDASAPIPRDAFSREGKYVVDDLGPDVDAGPLEAAARASAPGCRFVFVVDDDGFEKTLARHKWLDSSYEKIVRVPRPDLRTAVETVEAKTQAYGFVMDDEAREKAARVLAYFAPSNEFDLRLAARIADAAKRSAVADPSLDDEGWVAIRAKDVPDEKEVAGTLTKDGHVPVTYDDLTDAERIRLATHEAGHAACSVAAFGERAVDLVTIVPTRAYRGVTKASALWAEAALSRQLVDHVAVTLAGRIAEDEILGDHDGSACKRDVERARAAAEKYVDACATDAWLDPDSSGTILKEADERARTLVRSNLDLVTALSDALLEKGTLRLHDIARIARSVRKARKEPKND